MARPRIFVSSTYYDLKYVRADLERFIQELGYESVLHERGQIAYGKDEGLEQYAYKEIERCDILISVVGGRYGAEAKGAHSSISQKEVRTALELKKQVYVFVERNVKSEYETYLLNKDNNKIKYKFADNVEIFKFIESLHALPQNNTIIEFAESKEIITFLREQWAGLFQRLLQDQKRFSEAEMVESLSASARTLDQLVSFLTEERKNSDQAVKDILTLNHPAFEDLRAKLGIPYRILFTTKKELHSLLNVRGFLEVNKEQWDSPDFFEYLERGEKEKKKLIKLKVSLFDPEGKLIIKTPNEWAEDNIKIEDYVDEEEEEEEEEKE